SRLLQKHNLFRLSKQVFTLFYIERARNDFLFYLYKKPFLFLIDGVYAYNRQKCALHHTNGGVDFD
ncbi:hypothetical protein, partial [Escherichia coli]|uniref:hypothetical protein n=1 Tax=Escherichia coli TaxID=562 RepID=UPI001BC879A2